VHSLGHSDKFRNQRSNATIDDWIIITKPIGKTPVFCNSLILLAATHRAEESQYTVEHSLSKGSKTCQRVLQSELQSRGYRENRAIQNLLVTLLTRKTPALADQLNRLTRISRR